MHHFADLEAVHETLEKLVERGYVERPARRPGQKEERYRHLLSEDADATVASPTEPAAPVDLDIDAPPTAGDTVPDRLIRLEREVAELREQVRQLREALGEPAPPPQA